MNLCRARLGRARIRWTGTLNLCKARARIRWTATLNIELM